MIRFSSVPVKSLVVCFYERDPTTSEEDEVSRLRRYRITLYMVGDIAGAPSAQSMKADR
jgi:hypothetical protein